MRFMKSKRGQSAVEFLVTYGWAFLMVMGFVGALFYLDILNLSHLLPDRCEFSSEIDCLDKIIISSNEGEEDGIIRMMLTNNLGAPIEIEECHVRVPGIAGDDGLLCADAQGQCGSNESSLYGERWNQGEALLFEFSECDTRGYAMSPRNKEELYMSIQYHAIGSSPEYKHNITGMVFTDVQEAR